MRFVFFLIIAYAAGSINFSILLLKLLGKPDPRNHFSGNPGATNVYRVAGLKWAALVVTLDITRAIGVAWTAVAILEPPMVPWVGLGLILGNRFPLFHRFRGGKGVANFLGFTLALVPLWALGAVAVYGLALGLFRIPFVASFSMVFILSLGTIRSFDSTLFAAAGTITTMLFIYTCHHRNIRTLLKNKTISTGFR